MMPVLLESQKLFYGSRYSFDESRLACLLTRPVFIFIRVYLAADPWCNFN